MQIDTRFIYKNKRAVYKRHTFAATEAKMLTLLSKYTDVPDIYQIEKSSIVMEYIENNSSIDEQKATYTIANLHKHFAKLYGLEFDTIIGPFFQPNKQSDSWVEFFTMQRLLYMGKEALKEGSISGSLYTRLEILSQKLPELIPDTPQASLLHGDIWSGNLLFQNDKLYLIDPALYYGHNEVELAFIMMFNTFGKRFFDIYNEIYPIEKEFFKYRYKVYQIYPYLVHIRKYGAMYLPTLKRLLSHFV